MLASPGDTDVDLARLVRWFGFVFAKRATRFIPRSVTRCLSPTRERYSVLPQFEKKKQTKDLEALTYVFPSLLFTALAHERPRRLVIGHVLLRGHARNGAADRFSPKPRRRLP